jgi:hypothetical protein
MQLKFYRTRAPPYLMYDSETWSLYKNRGKMTGSSRDADNMWSQLGMRKFNK